MWSLAYLIEQTGAELVRGNREQMVAEIAPLKDAKKGQLSFYLNAKYVDQLKQTSASVVLTSTRLKEDCDLSLARDRTLLVHSNVEDAFLAILAMASPAPSSSYRSDQAYIHPQARLGQDVSYGRVSIAKDCVIGDNTSLADGVCLGEGVSLGKDCVLYANVVLYAGVVISDRVIIHAGSVIGSDGFGYIAKGDRHRKIPHLGKVIVEQDVEIGANCCIDRGSLGATRIGRGTKLDNLVHIGHNVAIGQNSLLCGQVGIAGSAEVGEATIMAGKAGVGDHVKVGKNSRIYLASILWQDSNEGDHLLGSPARNKTSFLREIAALEKLPAFLRRLARLEKKIGKDR